MNALKPLPFGVDARDARLIDRLHGELPLAERPFAVVGAELDMDEDEVLERLRRLLSQGLLTRLGPLYRMELGGGKLLLAALEVPEVRFSAVAALVNALPEVAVNRRREHAFNMWFVVATETAAQCDAVMARIAQATGLKVHAFPNEREYYAGLWLPTVADREAS